MRRALQRGGVCGGQEQLVRVRAHVLLIHLQVCQSADKSTTKAYCRRCKRGPNRAGPVAVRVRRKLFRVGWLVTELYKVVTRQGGVADAHKATLRDAHEQKAPPCDGLQGAVVGDKPKLGARRCRPVDGDAARLAGIRDGKAVAASARAEKRRAGGAPHGVHPKRERLVHVANL